MDKFKHHLDKLLLALVFVILSASTIAWTLADRTPPAWDPADHVSAGYDYYRELARFDLAGFARALFVEPRYYAPLAHLVTAVAFLIFGASRLTALTVNLISLAVILASVSWIWRMLYSGVGCKFGKDEGRTVKDESGCDTVDSSFIPHPSSFQDPRPLTAFYPGVVAALLANCYHFTAWLMHDAFLDYPLTAMVTAGFAFLIRAGDFRNLRYALMFGATAGLGLLTKQTFPFFFVLPAIYVTARVLASRDRRAIINLALAGALALAVAALWYGPHLDDVLAIYRVNREAAINENEAPLYSFVSNVYYAYGLISFQMQLPLGLLFVCGLCYSLARRRKESIMLYLWLISGIASFTLIANKEMRYTVPVLPAAALISVCWLGRSRQKEKVKSKKSRNHFCLLPFTFFLDKGRAVMKPIAVSAIVVWAFVSFFNAQWPGEGNGYSIEMPRFRWMVFYRNYYGLDHRPLASDWGVPGIIRAVVEDRNRNPHASANRAAQSRAPTPQETVSPPTHTGQMNNEDARPVLGVVVNLPFLNPSNVALYARLMAEDRAAPPIIKVDWLVAESVRDRMESCEYLLVRTGLDRADWVAPIEKYVENLIQANPDKFKKIAAFPIPLEQAEAVIYRCVE
ncbi:MAG: hypothetical protein L0229_01065 [Blastocatellia bacterium]|nr:hypothetical protein [Blastocatellia bacterium]